MAGTIENKRLADVDYCPQLINGYEIVEPVENSGGCADLYIGEKGGDKYVIKIYRFPLEKDMEHVLATVKEINNRSIAEIVDFGESENHAYEIQKYYNSGDPRDSIIYLPSHILPKINSALYSLHSNDVIHLDIKPENIAFIGKDVKLLDFGISSFAGGNISGYSENYSAPEVCYNAEAGNKADYYSLGITLFEIAMGYNPFAKLSSEQKEKLKKEPSIWIPYSAMESNFSDLISGLTIADPIERWGYFEVNKWLEKNDRLSELTSVRNDSGINFNNKKYMPYELTDYIDDCIFAGGLGTDELFNTLNYDKYKMADPWFAYMVYENGKLYSDLGINAAIKLKVEFGGGNNIVIPGKRWSRANELGFDMLNLASEIYDNIVYDCCNESFSHHINVKPVDTLYPEIWQLFQNNCLEYYISSNVVLKKIKNEYKLCLEEFQKIKSASSNKIFGDIAVRYGRKTNFNYNYNNYQFIYNLAYIGYTVTRAKEFSYCGEKYNSIDSFYNYIIGELNNNEANSNMLSYFLKNTFENEEKELLQPVLQAWVNILNGGK